MAYSDQERVCIYLRSDDHAMSREMQLDIIKKHPASKHESILLEDSGETRTSFHAILQRVRDEGTKVFVVARLDRLEEVSSTVGDFLIFLSPLLKLGVRFISIEDDVDTDQRGSIFLLRLEAAVLRAREVVRGEHIRLALKDSKNKGQRLGRPRSVSYEEVLLLRRKGLSIQAIAEKLGVTRGAVQHCLKISPDLSPT